MVGDLVGVVARFKFLWLVSFRTITIWHLTQGTTKEGAHQDLETICQSPHPLLRGSTFLGDLIRMSLGRARQAKEELRRLEGEVTGAGGEGR